VNAIVDQDLPRGVERATRRYRSKTPGHPVGRVGQRFGCAGSGGVELRAQLELLFHAIALPQAGHHEQRDSGDRGERRDDARPEPLARCGCGSNHQGGEHGSVIFFTLIGMKIFVVAVLIAIVVALFAALVFLYRDAGRGKRVVWLLTLRVGLSVSLIAFLLLSYWMGWIGAGGVK
jgi:hypothetical protein